LPILRVRIYTVSQKTALENLAITLSNINRFARFFHHCKHNEMFIL